MPSEFEKSPEPNADQLNDLAERMSQEHARLLRGDFIRLVHNTFRLYLYEDRFNIKKAQADMERGISDEDDNDGSVERFLMTDMLASPGLTEDELEDVLYYKLVRTKQRPEGTEFGADRIYIMMPVPSSFSVSDYSAELPEAREADTEEDKERKSRIFVKFEKDTPKGVHVRRFAISDSGVQEGVYEYVALGDPDHESEVSDILSRDMHYFVTGEQHLYNFMLAQLIEDHRNFTIEPQIGRKKS